MKLRYTKTALRQIEDALSYLEERSPEGAAGLRARVLAVVSFVREHPCAAQATSRRNTRRVVLPPYPYVIFYRLGAQEIIVTRFRHTARKPPPESASS